MIHEPSTRKPKVLRPLLHGHEFLVLDAGLEVLHVAAKSGEFRGDIQALSLVRALRIVDPVVGEVRNDLAGDDAVQRVRPGDAAEGEALEVIGRRGAVGLHASVVEVSR